MFGAGYVGLVTGACFADLGHEIVIRDVVPERIERLRAGEVPIYEPGLELVLERNKDRIRFTLDIAEAVDGAEFLYVAVGTPPTESGDADLAAVFSVIDELPAEVPGRPVIVMKSTVPVGTGAHVRARLDARGLTHVGYVSNPEFLAEGSAVADFMAPDRIVVGAFEDGDADRVVALFDGVETEIVRSDVPSAEFVKLASNAFLSTRISFINEIANVCELVRAWDPVARPEDLRGIELCDTVLEAVRDADAAVVVTEWPELRSLVSAEVRDAMARPVLIDGRNLLDPVAAHAAGFVYEGIGRPKHASAPEPHAPR